MLSTAARRAFGAVVSKSPFAQAAGAARGMSLSGMKGFNEHEQAVENMYFSKEEENALRKILSKVKVQAELDKTAAAHHAAAEEAALRHIVGKYNVSAADVKALLEWKHAHY